MARRVIAIVGMLVSMSLFAGQALGATATQLRVQGNGLTVSFTNAPDGADLPPGLYFGASLDAGGSIARGDTFVHNSVCLHVAEIRLHDDGNWSLERTYATCGQFATLSVRGDLGLGHLVASFPAICEEFHGPTWDCGTLDVDLTLAGQGPTTRYHDVEIVSEPGAEPDRSIVQAIGSSRTATFASGHVTLGDLSLTTGSVAGSAWLYDLQRGTITIDV